MEAEGWGWGQRCTEYVEAAGAGTRGLSGANGGAGAGAGVWEARMPR